MSIPEFDITGQKVLIVGGGRGIGKGIALAFAEAGADVAVSALTPTGVNKVAEEVQALGRNALALTGDATKAADMDRVAQQVLDRFGHLDTLVTCVGDSIRKPVVQLPGTATPGMTEDEWHFIVDINLTEAFQGCRALGPHLLARRQGAVVNISGWASFRGRAGSAAYDAAKAGVMRFSWLGSGPPSEYGSTPWPGIIPRPGADVGRGLPATGCHRRQDCPLRTGGPSEGGGLPGRVPGFACGGLRHWADLGCGRRGEHPECVRGLTPWPCVTLLPYG